MSAEYKLLGCEVLRKETEYLLAATGAEGRFDIEWLEMGLHETPEKLNAELRRRLAGCTGKGYRAVLLLFGLCSRATHGLEPPADSRLVIPRVHDCISLFLGSAGRYLKEHAAEAGTFWYSRGFLHRTDGKSPDLSGLGAGNTMLFGEGDGPKTMAEARQRFVDQYGEENADYLMETLVESWKKNYTRAVYMHWDRNPDAEADHAYVAGQAAKYGWRYQDMPVDLRLFSMLLEGNWPEEEFAVVPPGRRLAATNAADALRTEPAV